MRDAGGSDLDMLANVRNFYFVPLEDCNRPIGENYELAAREALIYPVRCAYDEETLTIEDVSFRIKGQIDEFPITGDAAMNVVSSIYVIVPDFLTVMEPLMKLKDYNGESIFQLKWYYGFDMAAEEETQIDVYQKIVNAIKDAHVGNDGGLYRCYVECRANERDDFYGTFGGIMFFLGLALSIVFLFAAVLIIYYKQVSEGYEDQSRFEIMQKVGMTRRMIRKSINSQLLTVFFMPLITAGVHLAFAFPMIQKLLMLFNMCNVRLLVMTTLISYAVFALFYLLVYRITSNAYYAIVSGSKDRMV